MCTTVAFPFGAIIGTGWTCLPCVDIDRFSAENRKRAMYLFASLFDFGCICLYLPLTVFCAVADGDTWMPYKNYGSCWSRSDRRYLVLGAAAGICIGIGLLGFLTMLIHDRTYIQSSPDEPSNKKDPLSTSSHYVV